MTQIDDLPLPFDEPRYTLGQACRLAGADPRQVTNWQQRGNVVLGTKISPKRRHLSTWDVLELSVVARLTGMNVTIENASVWAKHGVADLRNGPRGPARLNTPNDRLKEVERCREFGLFLFGGQREKLTPRVQGIDVTFHTLAATAKSDQPFASLLFVPIGALLREIVLAQGQGAGDV